MKRAGVAADNPKLRTAIRWLVANQNDGAWPANYLNKQRDPQDNLGKFMRDAATAFAVMALTEPSGSVLSEGGKTQPSDSQLGRSNVGRADPNPEPSPSARLVVRRPQ